ncbi:hypothetical protein DFQ26_005046 [Actinomortierella ambigua]|nr:hypothetical protein DFQ26_005046 [Actinomortierella ambigua]
MVVKDIKLQSISAPIPVPGTQQEPTTPSAAALCAVGSTTIIHISSNGGGHHDSTMPTTTTTVSSMTAGKATLSNGASSVGSNGSGVSGGGHVSHSTSANSSTVVSTSRAAGTSASQGGQQGNNHNNNHNSNHHSQQQQQGLRRFTSIGSKRLSNENLTLRAKVAELERYLTGLKEELILAHRQIHAKAQQSKAQEERKSLEIHELGQHIQRCEFDLLAKTAECETLQRKLQYQTKDHMTKLKQIDMLETEIMDFRRISLSGPSKPMGSGGGGPGGGGGQPGVTASLTSPSSSPSVGPGNLAIPGSGGTSVGDETSGDDGLESVRSSACLEAHRASSLYEGTHEQLRLLKDESLRKDKTVEELMDKIDRLSAKVLKLEREKAQLEQQQQQQQPGRHKEGDKKENLGEQPATFARLMAPITTEDMMSTTMPGYSPHDLSALDTSVATLSGSAMEGGFISGPTSAGSLRLAPSRLMVTTAATLSVNSVGYDWAAEHPKLLSKYQALQRNYVEVMEYLQMIENENKELKVQILDVGLLDITELPSSSSSSMASSAAAATCFATGVMPDSPIASPSSSPSTSRAPTVPGKSPQRFSKDGRYSPVAVL